MNISQYTHLAHSHITRIWRSSSLRYRILRNVSIIAILTLIVKFTGLGKEVLTAFIFGTSGVLDAFLIAFLLPSFFLSVIGQSLASALTPIYIRFREQDKAHHAAQLADTITFITLGIFLAITALLFILGPHLIALLASAFSEENISLAQSLLLLLLP